MRGPSTQDRLEIYELYARYSWALDTGDTEGYVALFTPDAEATEETREGRARSSQGTRRNPQARAEVSQACRLSRSSAPNGPVRV